MVRFSLVLFLLFTIESSTRDIPQSKIDALSKKGVKIAEIFCEVSKLPKVEPTLTIDEVLKLVKDSKSCKHLSPKKIEALGYYLKFGKKENTAKLYEEVPKSAKCPVCGMFVDKYPKWASKIRVVDKNYYFDGVKDMMKFYFFDGDFPFDRSKISSISVSDFYTLESIDAKKAFFVVGSNVYGPMGNELIPFKSLDSAKEFLADHKGEKILRWNEITPKIVMALDGIEMK